MCINTILLSTQLEVFDHAISARPRFPIHWRTSALCGAQRGPLLTKPDVVGRKFCLKPGGLVCTFQPCMTTDLIIAIKDSEVILAILQQIQSSLDPVVTCPNDAVWMRILMPRRLKRFDPMHRHPLPHLVRVLQALVCAALLHHKEDFIVLNEPQLCGQGILQVLDLRANLQGQAEDLLRGGYHQLAVDMRSADQLSSFRTSDGKVLFNAFVWN
mmetsp:Transcript_82597/g.130606  ORF Transcript_82597/g.130606 Transcript_82597/m.130606 type:complete len:214 (-) Transcript_82597:48-689(-)